MYRLFLFMLFVGLTQAPNVIRVVVKPHIMTKNFGLKMPSEQTRILNEMSWALRLTLLKDKQKENDDKIRPVNVQALVMPALRRQTETKPAEEVENDDNNMKMKLFRLMYETVRDSDLKVKRAELIKKHYSESSAFEVGYLLGDVTDKFNIMSDISLTLKRLYREWKPIEHINAYEQIANLGIDVNHIVDMIKGVEKRTRGQHRSIEETQLLPKADFMQYYIEKQLQAMSTFTKKVYNFSAPTERKHTKQNMAIQNKIQKTNTKSLSKQNVVIIKQSVVKTNQNNTRVKQNVVKTNQNNAKVKQNIAKTNQNDAKFKQNVVKTNQNNAIVKPNIAKSNQNEAKAKILAKTKLTVVLGRI